MSPPQPVPEVIHALPRLAARPADSNKGDFGRILIVAGSRGMSGAAVLCGSAALRSGAGLVYVAVPESIQPIIGGANPCYLTAALPEDEQGLLSAEAAPALLKLAEGKHVLAVGPGLGRGPGISSLIAALLTQVPLPPVLGVAGHNAGAPGPGLFKGCKTPRRTRPCTGDSPVRSLRE